MRAQGNGTPGVCAENLLKILRGEVPYERIKGLDPSLIDKPFSEARADLRQDAEWLITTYEPRVAINSIRVGIVPDDPGSFSVSADVTELEV